MRVLVVAPHPDDEVLGCGGTIRGLSQTGHDVHVCIATRGWEPLFPESQVEQVRGEARQASATLGAKLSFLDLPVTRLAQMPEHELNGAVSRLIDSISPDWVFMPFRSDLHEDHRQLFDALLVALRPLPERSHRVQRILCYETVSETHWAAPGVDPAFEPQVYVDISPHLEAKLDAMRLYASQNRPAPHARSIESIRALAQFRGMTVGLHAAEAFVLLRDVMIRLEARP